MGRVIDLETWRIGRRTPPQSAPVRRLDAAVARLDPLVTAAEQRGLDPRTDTDLLAITGAISLGMFDEAARRAERLADRLEHPAGAPVSAGP